MIRSHISAWANVALALAGPALVAVLGAQLAPNQLTLATHAIGCTLGPSSAKATRSSAWASANVPGCYAIARLSDLTGSCLLASIVSVVSLGLAHVPMWGWAPAATTIVSGGIGTVVYLWRQDIVALILAHIATDLYGIVLAPHLAHGVAN